jgi:hypothetical protein
MIDMRFECPDCGPLDQDVGEILTWDDEDPIMCSCEHQLVLKVLTNLGNLSGPVMSVGDVRRAIDELIKGSVGRVN